MGQTRELEEGLSWGCSADRVSLSDIRDAFGRSAHTSVKALNLVQFIEASRSVAVTAIALKRYQLRHDQLPAEPAALVPEFLPAIPRDPVDGQPLRYQLKPDGSFLLYSVGEDGMDDSGDPSGPKQRSASPQMQRGRDWVWPQPATAEEIDAYKRELELRHQRETTRLLPEGLVAPFSPPPHL
jgi:hypothetical protein